MNMTEYTETTWLAGRKPATYPKLSKQVSCDVCVIGGGLAGILCACRLATAGKRVVVLESDRLGSGATSATTAFITQAIDTDPAELTSMFGQSAAKQVWESGNLAIDEIEKLIKKERLQCDFMRCPAILYPSTEEQKKKVRLFVSALGRLGFKGTMDDDHFILPRQAKFHPLKFLDGLAKRLAKPGGKVKIFEHSAAKDIKDEDGKITVLANDTKVICKDVIIATYQPLGNPWDTFLKKGMYKSYVMEVRLKSEHRAEGLYWDFSNPYHYYRLDHIGGGEDRIIFGGADTKDLFPISKVDPEKQFRLLFNNLYKVVKLTEYEVTRKWIGPILEPTDDLPLIGRFQPHHYVATAFSGNGMTYSMLASIIITDLITEDKSEYAHLYNPERIPSIKQLMKKAEDYLEELDTAVIKPRTTKRKMVA